MTPSKPIIDRYLTFPRAFTGLALVTLLLLGAARYYTDIEHLGATSHASTQTQSMSTSL